MAQQAVYFESLLLRSPSHFGWDPFPLYPFADAFHFVKEPGSYRSYRSQSGTPSLATTTKRRRPGGERDDGGETKFQFRGVLKNRKQERLLDNEGVQNKFSVVPI